MLDNRDYVIENRLRAITHFTGTLLLAPQNMLPTQQLLQLLVGVPA
jgi:hypothetical protein